MSLLEFPPLSQADFPYCLQEVNGRLFYGSKEDVERISKSNLLCDYPAVDKCQLHTLQHSLSRDNVRRVFTESQSSRVQQAVHVWQKDGIRGLLNFVVNSSEGTPFGWPITTAGRALQRAERDVLSILAFSEENLHDVIAQTSDTLNWRTNWVRCIAYRSDGERLAICQANDYVRIFGLGRDNKPPITLKHRRQKNVSYLAWKPYDHLVLAVACDDAVLIWRLSPKSPTNRPSAQCAQVLDVPPSFCPVTQCVWDKELSFALFVTSPSSTRILVLDTLSGEGESVGDWVGSRVRRIWPSPDGSKLLVSYSSSSIKVYDRDSWSEEKWSHLGGVCTAAVWSPDSSFILFCTDSEETIRAVRFSTRMDIVQGYQQILRRYGAEFANVVFDVSMVNCGPDLCGEPRMVGGAVRDMQISPDGQRLAVAFESDTTIIALFMVDWSLSFILTPCGFIKGHSFGDATIFRFYPKFSTGSLLSVVWSSGCMQYIPLLYGPASDVSASSRLLCASSSSSQDPAGSSEILQPAFVESQQENSSSTSDDDRKGKRSAEVGLFSTSGLYDQLLLTVPAE